MFPRSSTSHGAPTEHHFDIRMLLSYVIVELQTAPLANQWTATLYKDSQIAVETPRRGGSKVYLTHQAAVEIVRVYDDDAHAEIKQVLFHLASAMKSYWRFEMPQSHDEPDFWGILCAV
jgi:hypothetical protein